MQIKSPKEKKYMLDIYINMTEYYLVIMIYLKQLKNTKIFILITDQFLTRVLFSGIELYSIARMRRQGSFLPDGEKFNQYV